MVVHKLSAVVSESGPKICIFCLFRKQPISQPPKNVFFSSSDYKNIKKNFKYISGENTTFRKQTPTKKHVVFQCRPTIHIVLRFCDC